MIGSSRCDDRIVLVSSPQALMVCRSAGHLLEKTYMQKKIRCFAKGSKEYTTYVHSSFRVLTRLSGNREA